MGEARRSFTIRFKHIDGARIVFYPRYFEMSSTFEGSTLLTPPFALQTEFLRPNRLGDRLTLTHRYDSSGRSVSVSGEIQGTEYFSVRSLANHGSMLHGDSHRTDRPSYKTADCVLGESVVDLNGVLQVSRYFELVSDSVELWLEGEVGVPLAAMQNERNMGIPTACFTTRCSTLPHAGDRFQTWVRPMRIGSKSLTLCHWLVKDDRCLVSNEQVIVFVEMTADGYRSIEIPGDIRAKIADKMNVAA